jgi:hypothetical protein
VLLGSGQYLPPYTHYCQLPWVHKRARVTWLCQKSSQLYKSLPQNHHPPKISKNPHQPPLFCKSPHSCSCFTQLSQLYREAALQAHIPLKLYSPPRLVPQRMGQSPFLKFNCIDPRNYFSKSSIFHQVRNQRPELHVKHPNYHIRPITGSLVGCKRILNLGPPWVGCHSYEKGWFPKVVHTGHGILI